MKLAILGTGNMAEALIAGLTAKNKKKNIIGFDLNRKRLGFIQKKYRINKAKNVDDAVRKSTVVLLAVKPQQMKDLLTKITPHVSKNHLILSIAAGIDIEFLSKYLGKGKRIVRIMPNTPALVGLGATVFYLNRHCRAEDRRVTQKIFSTVGEVSEVKQEKLLDAVTGLSGSGPAYVFSFIQALIRGGQKSGLNKTLASQLTVQTLLGATKLLSQSNESPEKLIAKVTSKGGTTAAGLKVLKQKKFGKTVEGCVIAATRRARELRKI